MMRSAGLPASAIQLAEAILKEGISRSQVSAIRDDDPAWEKLGHDPARHHVGFIVRMESPNSRLTTLIFYEGTNDETINQIAAVAGVPALPDTAS